MNPLTERETFTKAFVERSHHVDLHLSLGNGKPGSRMGGKAPACFASRTLTCPRCSKPLVYYLTLESDVLGPIFGPERSISIFYCADTQCRRKGQHVVNQSPVIAIPHVDCPPSSKPTPMDSGVDPCTIHVGSLSVDLDARGEFKEGAKIGGQPGLLMDSGEQDVVVLSNQGMAFLFQFDEESIPAACTYPSSPFDFGAVYVFCKLDYSKRIGDVSQIVTFWQSS